MAIGMPKNLYAKISSDFEYSSWSKTTLCILRNKYGFQIGNAMEKINCFDFLSEQREALHLSLSIFMQVINCRGQHSSTLCAGLTTSLSTDPKTYTLLTSVHNDTDNTDARDDANDYNLVIGIARLKAFSCAKNGFKLSPK